MAEAIHGCHQYANFRCDPCDDDRIHTEHPKGLVQVGFKEGAKAPLGQYDIRRHRFEII